MSGFPGLDFLLRGLPNQTLIIIIVDSNLFRVLAENRWLSVVFNEALEIYSGGLGEPTLPMRGEYE